MPRYSLLIVDDEAGIRQSLGDVLKDEGYRVEAVESAEACLESLGKKRCDLVLLDIWLPASTVSRPWKKSGGSRVLPPSS